MKHEIEHVWSKLRSAMLASDVSEIDALIDGHQVLLGPGGALYGKEDDLVLHRSGATRFTRVEI